MSELGSLTGVERDIRTDIRRAMDLRHIKDVIGVRRAGKTTTLYQIIAALIEDGADPREIALLNLDDPELSKTGFKNLVKTLEKMHPSTKYLFLDEVQQKEEWERWIRTWYDTQRFEQIFVSGSSASLISRDVGRVLSGRHTTFTIFPFSFREFLKFHEWKSFEGEYLYHNRNELLHYQERYLEEGGFPETLGKTDAQKELILTNIYNDILSRDIAARFNASYDISKRISYHLLSNVSNEFSYNRVAQATDVSADTADKYINYLLEAFLILELDFFSYKTREQFKRNKKAYAIDTGLRNAVSFKFMEDKSSLMENVILLELLRRGYNPFYWKDKQGMEVDFLVRGKEETLGLVQSCWDPSGETREREVESLTTALDAFKMKEGCILTEDYEEEEQVEEKKIHFIPLWKWLLSPSILAGRENRNFGGRVEGSDRAS
ncbi:hypothetical protein AKJ44_00295 [candidate division MSBL1 archaeon SCGC-AAA261F17]|uniref:ATPase n=1 Tax=candidate division MSBL1 archaeon SCGC-AAA261F17 TaxID=1698274 RepID=A0A133V7Q3_9EURY|nr:hypothetical protein AKJ44_00295 [candidate division MSBL1 archaeon SCGC-AAA261F17]